MFVVCLKKSCLRYFSLIYLFDKLQISGGTIKIGWERNPTWAIWPRILFSI